MLLPLKRLVDSSRPITYGIVQAGPDVDGGVPYIRPVDMSEHDGVVDPSGLQTTSQEIAAQYQRSAVRPGDIVVSIGPSYGKTMVVPAELGGANLTQGTARVAPAQDVDARYLRWALRSKLAIAHWDAAVGGATFRALNLGPLAETPIPLRTLAEQRAIADYLDAETARIDALIAKKQQLIHLLEERRVTAFDKALSRFGVDLPIDLDPKAMRRLSLPDGWRVAKLSSALRQLTNGYVGPTRDILVDEGIRYIQGLHVKKGTIDFERRPFFVTESWHRARPRTSLRPGDVVIVQTGDIGQCAVVPDDFGEANCHALLIARANEKVTSGGYLAAYLQSGFGRHSLLRLATGALHPHLEFGIRDAALLLPPKSEQSEIVGVVRGEQDRLDMSCGALSRQINLLAEHRQALITAAVTGECAVRGAA